ncbi:IclR family transcriptional regulator [Lentibacter algarum]|uniref:IclR family transcriptional regulator n=1 Tax=Lentibacter algarum TaxID=576131 RepID=UPI001C077F9B|nr:IclR family transcriptional regulator [Lentibacter algarum]MBU2980201.1 IclR family transcriptional regulator [Lentibacter algarum]
MTNSPTNIPDGAKADKLAKPGIQSIARAFAILEVIAESRDGISLAELSKAVELHNSTAFHLVKTMTQLGYVRQDPSNKNYFLGRPLYQLAAASRGDEQLEELSKEFVAQLAERTGETAHFAVPARDNVMIVSKFDGSSAFKLSERLGEVRPCYCTAIGKMYLSTLSDSDLEGYLKRASYEACAPNTITDPDRLREEIMTIRKEGISFDDAEYHPELRCAAVPVYDIKNNFVGAIGISGAVWRLSLSALQNKVPILHEISRQMSLELGHRPAK